VITKVPDVYVETLALTAVNPDAFCCHSPAAVAVVASVRVAPIGTTAAATQFVPSTVASNVTVPENVPVSCHATAPFSALTGSVTEPVAPSAPVAEPVVSVRGFCADAVSASIAAKTRAIENCLMFIVFLFSSFSRTGFLACPPLIYAFTVPRQPVNNTPHSGATLIWP
jgi:hypothetical protein